MFLILLCTNLQFDFELCSYICRGEGFFYVKIQKLGIYLFFVPLFSEMENHHHHQNHAGMPMMTKNEEPMGSMMNSDSQSEPMNHMHHSMSPAMDHMMKM